MLPGEVCAHSMGTAPRSRARTIETCRFMDSVLLPARNGHKRRLVGNLETREPCEARVDSESVQATGPTALTCKSFVYSPTTDFPQLTSRFCIKLFQKGVL